MNEKCGKIVPVVCGEATLGWMNVFVEWLSERLTWKLPFAWHGSGESVQFGLTMYSDERRSVFHDVQSCKFNVHCLALVPINRERRFLGSGHDA